MKAFFLLKQIKNYIFIFVDIIMEEIFAQAKNILIIWTDDANPEKLPAFQQTIQLKAKHARIAFENARMLFGCKFN